MASEYRHKDLYISAYLYLQFKEFVRVERMNGVCWFVFRNENKQCEQLVDDYVSNKAQVKAKAFTESVKALRDVIHY